MQLSLDLAGTVPLQLASSGESGLGRVPAGGAGSGGRELRGDDSGTGTARGLGRVPAGCAGSGRRELFGDARGTTGPSPPSAAPSAASPAHSAP
jgi:hypothetical protein